MRKGLLIVLSGPSGTGKSTVCRALLKKHEDIALSVSCTTRAPRKGETDGVSYFFIAQEQFSKMIEENAFLEYAQVFDNYYGTPRSFVEQQLCAGKDVLLEIDVQGALKAKEAFPEGVYVFLVPPSRQELERRIRSRGTETEQQIATRLGKANAEMKLIRKYDYVIVNDEVEKVIGSVENVLAAERLKVSRNIEDYNF